jgi:hypothetical protein
MSTRQPSLYTRIYGLGLLCDSRLFCVSSSLSSSLCDSASSRGPELLRDARPLCEFATNQLCHQPARMSMGETCVS